MLVSSSTTVRNWEEEVKCGHPRTCHMIYFLLAAPATRVQVHKFCLLCFNLGRIIIVLYNPMATVVRFCISLEAPWSSHEHHSLRTDITQWLSVCHKCFVLSNKAFIESWPSLNNFASEFYSDKPYSLQMTKPSVHRTFSLSFSFFSFQPVLPSLAAFRA